MIGAGTMGAGIAEVFALAGDAVRLIESDPGQLERGLERIARSLDRAVGKGALTADESRAAVERITASADLADAADSELVMEVIHENLEAKLELFRTLDAACPPETVLASNTSSISITTLGAATRRPEQVIGMHFFNPAPAMALVEVVRGRRTSDETHDAVMTHARRLGKTPVSVRDSPGFVANRVLLPMINEAIYVLSEGVASAEDIDTVMRLGMNHPMGPLRLADLIGLDVCLEILRVLHEGFGDPKYRPCPLLRQMVAAGKLGRKSGEGFYSYAG